MHVPPSAGESDRRPCCWVLNSASGERTRFYRGKPTRGDHLVISRVAPDGAWQQGGAATVPLDLRART